MLDWMPGAIDLLDGPDRTIWFCGADFRSVHKIARPEQDMAKRASLFKPASSSRACSDWMESSNRQEHAPIQKLEHFRTQNRVDFR
jgi:hypothetical protein